MPNPKSEIRNPKEARTPKCERSTGPSFGIRNSGFGFLSDFGFRISDFLRPARLLSSGCVLLVLGAGCVSDKKPPPPIPPVVAGTLEQIHMLTSPFAVNMDGMPGPDGIAAKVYAGSESQPRFFPIESGTLEILMFDGFEWEKIGRAHV